MTRNGFLTQAGPQVTLSASSESKFFFCWCCMILNEIYFFVVQIIPAAEVIREDKIGRGGFGNVYKGKWKFNPIAIKETKGSFHFRFLLSKKKNACSDTHFGFF